MLARIIDPNSFKKIALLFILTIELSVTLAAPTDKSKSGNCSAEFQKKFDELIALDQSACRAIVFKDCCQIAKGAYMFVEHNIQFGEVHPINDVCNNEPRSFTTSHSPTIQARCDSKDGWLVILRRKADVSPLVNFHHKWVEYENGFGDLKTEFWYGLKNIHCLTQRDDVELMIELKQNDGTGETWTYQTFRVGGSETNYVLQIGEADGHGAEYDYMAYHNGRQFTTIDNDNDASESNCADGSYAAGGGWWFNSCFDFIPTSTHSVRKNVHRRPGGTYSYFPHVEMKIRTKTCSVTTKQSESCE